MKKIYFLCTGNSCRSQMAEGYAKVILGDQYEIRSAGVEAHGLNLLAIEVMSEDGIDISQQSSKLIDPIYFERSDLIITLCGDARDRCPMVPPQAKSIHWNLPDPAQAQGSYSEKLKVFRQVRDEIKKYVLDLDHK